MVFIFAEAELDWQLKWFFRPRQGTVMTVEDYHTQFHDWKEEMINLSFPAEENDYIDGFIENLRWDIRSRSLKYMLSRNSLINAFCIAKIEESRIEMEKSVKRIDEHRVFDKTPSRTSAHKLQRDELKDLARSKGLDPDELLELDKSFIPQNSQSPSSIPVSVGCASSIFPSLETGIQMTDGTGQPSPLKLEGPKVVHNLDEMLSLSSPEKKEGNDEMLSLSLPEKNEGNDNTKDGGLPVVCLTQIMGIEVDIKGAGSILEADLFVLKGPKIAHHMFDENTKLSPVYSDEDVYGNGDSLSSFSHILDLSNVEKSKGVLTEFEKWHEEENNLKIFNSSYMHGESMVYNYSIFEAGCRLFDPGGCDLALIVCDRYVMIGENNLPGVNAGFVFTVEYVSMLIMEDDIYSVTNYMGMILNKGNHDQIYCNVGISHLQNGCFSNSFAYGEIVMRYSLAKAYMVDGVVIIQGKKSKTMWSRGMVMKAIYTVHLYLGSSSTSCCINHITELIFTMLTLSFTRTGMVFPHLGKSRSFQLGNSTIESETMSVATQRVESIILELGENSLIAEFKDVGIDRAVGLPMCWCFWTIKQICITTFCLIIHVNIATEFLERFVNWCQVVKVLDPLEVGWRLGLVASKGQYDMILIFISKAVNKVALKIEQFEEFNGKVIDPCTHPPQQPALFVGLMVQPSSSMENGIQLALILIKCAEDIQQKDEAVSMKYVLEFHQLSAWSWVTENVLSFVERYNARKLKAHDEITGDLKTFLGDRINTFNDMNPHKEMDSELYFVKGQVGLESVDFFHPLRHYSQALKNATLMVPTGMRTTLVRSIGFGESILAVELENSIWDPGQCAIFIYILEDKDVLKRKGIWIQLSLKHDEGLNAHLEFLVCFLMEWKQLHSWMGSKVVDFEDAIDANNALRVISVMDQTNWDYNCRVSLPPVRFFEVTLKDGHVVQVKQHGEGLAGVCLILEMEQHQGSVLIFTLQRTPAGPAWLHTLSRKQGHFSINSTIRSAMELHDYIFNLDVKSFVWDPSPVWDVYVTTLRTRCLFRGRRCHICVFISFFVSGWFP